jgi:hypothetical protein
MTGKDPIGLTACVRQVDIKFILKIEHCLDIFLDKSIYIKKRQQGGGQNSRR